MKQILLVEDDHDIAALLRLNLEDEGYAITHEPDGGKALLRLEKQPWDAVILDLMLPSVDGLEICRRIRQMTRYLPVIIISARSNETDRITGLETGADDYVVKPYSVVELMARLRTQLRRTRPATMGERLVFDDIILDAAEHRVFRDGQPLKLGPTEFRLLSTLMEKPGRVWTRDQLLDRVWGRDIYVDTRTIDVHVGRLRKALMVNGGADPVRTVRGTGYSLG